MSNERLVFVSSIDRAEIGKGTQSELRRLSSEISKMIEPPPPVELHPVYDIANLVIAIQKASQGFHQRWRAILTAEHWTRIKALTRRLGVMNKDEYDQLRPLADLIQELQNNIHTFISRPLRWEPPVKDEERMDEKTQVTDLIRQGASTRLDELAKQRLVDQKIPGWSDAFYRRGIGSTLVRARDIKSIYDAAAPIPVELPDDEATKFLFDVRIAVAEAIKEQKESSKAGSLEGCVRAHQTWASPASYCGNADRSALFLYEGLRIGWVGAAAIQANS